MSDVWGANPDELDALAARFADSAGRIDTLGTSARADLRALPWDGRDADQFRNRWESEGVRLLSSAAALLRGAGDVVLGLTELVVEGHGGLPGGGGWVGAAGGGPEHEQEHGGGSSRDLAATDGQRNVWFGVVTGLHPAAEVPESS